MHIRMTSMTSSVERTDLDFKISVALGPGIMSSLDIVWKVNMTVDRGLSCERGLWGQWGNSRINDSD